jgi:hypothetical protein
MKRFNIYKHPAHQHRHILVPEIQGKMMLDLIKPGTEIGQTGLSVQTCLPQVSMDPRSVNSKGAYPGDFQPF